MRLRFPISIPANEFAILFLRLTSADSALGCSIRVLRLRRFWNKEYFVSAVRPYQIRSPEIFLLHSHILTAHYSLLLISEAFRAPVKEQAQLPSPVPYFFRQKDSRVFFRAIRNNQKDSAALTYFPEERPISFLLQKYV